MIYMLEFEEYKVKLNGLKPALEHLGTALKLTEAEAEIAELEKESAAEGFWNDMSRSQKVQKRLKQLQNKCAKYAKLNSQWEDLMTLCEMALAEEDDSMLDELREEYAELEETLENMRLATLLAGEYDANNAILTFHAGAGGTEAQDWASMLYRMYTRWAERHGYKYTLLDWLDGEEAGIKSATIKIEGENAYGYLKSEHGVHRLVRLSPFNADNLRQTSFSLVEVLPIIKSDADVKIDEKDLRIDVYHSGGHGGQSVNTTNSAVRITHLPTNTVVAIQNERSQLQNKEKAMEILRGKLVQMKIEQQAESIDKLRAGESAKWGQQIRNYVLQPYKLVKDTRTKHEETDADAVLDGEIMPFIDSFLEQ